ncbi:MAG: hypothetical protein WCK47_08590 [bacterium]
MMTCHSRVIVAAAAIVLAIMFSTMTGVSQTPRSTPAGLDETSVTLAQIVARQRENYARLRSARGEVIWREDDYAVALPSRKAPLRVVDFAFEGDRSVLFIVPWDGVSPIPKRGSGFDWTKMMAGCLVEGDWVSMLTMPRGARQPEVRMTLYNPAVHDKNPLVSFHPSLLGDERVGLAELLSVAGQMTTRPLVRQSLLNGELRLRVDFANPAAPGEFIYYIVNPQKGCLAEDIGRYSGGRLTERAQIIIGKTKDGVWIPARRNKTICDTKGRPLHGESWYYRSLDANQKMGSMELSLLYFHLPEGTRIYGAPSKKDADSTGTKPAQPDLAP